ncbi:MAG: hypothetical protein RJA80_177, partial [Actinomycetota bacterium]
MRDYLLAQGFKECFVYDPISKANVKAWSGFILKQVEPLTVSENPSLIEQFLFDTCVAFTTARISQLELYEALFE